MTYDEWKLDDGENYCEISSERNAVCDAIEDDRSHAIACNTAESLTGMTFDPDRLSVRVDGDEMLVSVNVGIEVSVDPGDPQTSTRAQFAKAHRSIADQLDRQWLQEVVPASPEIASHVDWISVFAGLGMTLITYLAWRLW